MRRITLLLTVALAALGTAVPADAAKKRRPIKKQLTVFRSCSGLAEFANRRLDRFGTDVLAQRRGGFVAIDGLAAPMPVAQRDQAQAQGEAGAAPMPAAAPTAGTDYSTTNVQEAGVDEPDAVKTDGNRLYVAMNQKLYALDVSGEAPRLLGTLPLEGYSHELLLRGDRLLVLSTAGFGGGYPEPMPQSDGVAASSPAFMPVPSRTLLQEVDTDALQVVRQVELPGSIVGGRLRGGTARIAIATPTGADPAEGSPEFRRWMPTMQIERTDTGATQRRSLAPCTSVRRPQIFAGLGLLTLLTIDLDKGIDPVDSDAILADASTVYSSADRMYLATERWVDPQVIAEDGAPAGRSTTIHGFDVSKGDQSTYVGSGNVRGYLLNQFSFSEHKGALRVATTEEAPWLPCGMPPEGEQQQSESFVTVLDESAGRLVQVGRVGGLGKGERIYSVRFVGDVGFVVTFRQVDPLYTLDLSDKTAPRVVGELKIPGYSSYLHPIGDGLLIGIGQDATDQGRTQGAQVSLFDVGDLRNPRRIQQKPLGRYAYTQAEYDHHAFLWWAPTKLLVLPMNDYDPDKGESYNGAVGLRVERGGIAEAGRTEHPKPNEDYYSAPPIVRSLIANGRVYTISYFGVQAGRLDTLAGTAFVPLNP